MKDETSMKRDRIVQARMQLKARFAAKMANLATEEKTRAQGHGPLNRHGMPQVPVDQTLTQKWPVLDLGVKPKIELEKWKLVVDGACRAPVTMGWSDFMKFDQIRDTSDFHCVTTWSKLHMQWRGVRFADIAAFVEVGERATHIMCYGSDDYSTNLSLEEALKPDVLLVHTFEDNPLESEHGGPVRMITPQLYAWKGAKWICRIEFMREDRLGFWEQRGYSNTAKPWQNDRYSGDEAPEPII